MNKELLHSFVLKFRVNSNLRAGFLPPNIDDFEFPFKMYHGAYNEAIEEIQKERECTDEELNVFHDLFQVFMDNLKESLNYNVAENIMIKRIEE
ncbi:MAG: hypothetical protein EWM50_03700 [Gottschalkiaceae bacterium]|nr:MAG: hypothetical protein EWM50_03700 [Gottschalkiaceae bacterium]